MACGCSVLRAFEQVGGQHGARTSRASHCIEIVGCRVNSHTPGVQVDDRIGQRCKVRRQCDEELATLAAKAQHLALHRHEHALVPGVERPVGLVREQRVVASAGMLCKVQGNGMSHACLDERSLATAHEADALAPAVVPVDRGRGVELCRVGLQVPGGQLQGRC